MFWAVFKMDSQTGVNNHGSQFSDHHIYCDRELLDQTSFVDTVLADWDFHQVSVLQLQTVISYFNLWYNYVF